MNPLRRQRLWTGLWAALASAMLPRLPQLNQHKPQDEAVEVDEGVALQDPRKVLSMLLLGSVLEVHDQTNNFTDAMVISAASSFTDTELQPFEIATLAASTTVGNQLMMGCDRTVTRTG